jgi:hypothetical protein
LPTMRAKSIYFIKWLRTIRTLGYDIHARQLYLIAPEAGQQIKENLPSHEFCI